jgi:hypothetical protein
VSNATSYAPQITAVEPHEQSIEVIRAALIEIQSYIKTREPEHDGDALDKLITWRDAVNAGLAQYSLGTPGGSGPGGGEFEPPPGGGLAGWDDLTPPDTLDNLVVTSIPTGFFVQFDAPTYRQGGGNAYSIIYQANWDGVSPLPTFADSVPVGTVNERNVILVVSAEPGVQGHFWAQPVSHAEDFNLIAPQTAPTGGLNGEYTTAGQLSDDHIADLSAGKITAGQIAVGEYIESTGYDPGAFGWHIDGDGDAEFNNVVVRGTIYATAGLIGGAVIDADGVESDNYVPATSGWRLDNTTGILYAFDAELYGTFTGDISLPAYSVSIPEGDLIDTRGNGAATYDTFTSSVTGGTSPFTYLWLLANTTSDNDNNPWGISIDGSATSSTVDIKGYGTDNAVLALLVLLVTDANGRVAKDSVAIGITHGTPP